MAQQTEIFCNSREAKSREKYKNNLYGLGIAECVLGGLSIILAIASLPVEMKIRPSITGIENLFTYTAQGIWNGFFIVVTGILGICARGNPSLRIFNANMALSIITAVVSAFGIVLSTFATLLCGFGIAFNLFVIHASISLLLFAGFIIVIVHSGFCCAGVCKRNYNEGTVVYIAQVPQPHQVAGLHNVQVVTPTETVMTPTPQICLAATS